MALAIELDLTPPQADMASAVGALRSHGRSLLLDNAESPRNCGIGYPPAPDTP
jgi:hypothetical protein